MEAKGGYQLAKFIGMEVKRMKNLLALLTAVTLVISTSGMASAEFQSDGTVIFSASSGSISGTPGISVPFSASLKKLSDDTAATSITWTGVVGGTTGWLKADQYVAVKGFATYSDWGIQIYTNNTNYTGTGNPAGLVRTDNTIYSLPMCWRTKVGYYDLTTGNPKKKGSESAIPQELQINEGISDGYTILYDSVPGHAPGKADDTKTEKDYFPWFFMLDKRTPDVDLTTTESEAFGNYQQDATFIGSKGYHHAPGNIAVNFATPSHPNDSYYLYLGAKFTLAVPGKTYSTDSITVEIYHL